MLIVVCPSHARVYDRRLGAEDPLYVVARPDRLRKMGTAASGEEVTVSSGVSPAVENCVTASQI